jgi:ABC-type antimicrobial peptide transport system permease subunit
MSLSMPLSFKETVVVRTLKMIVIPLVRHRGAMIGIILVLIALLIAAFASFIAPYDPLEMNVGGNLEPH